MQELLRECLYPVLLGANTVCHACVREAQKRYGVASTVLTGKRALTLRFLPSVTLVEAPPTLSDEMLLSILRDIEEESGTRIPLLVLCDKAYGGFVERNKRTLEARFILRRAEELLGVRDSDAW